MTDQPDATPKTSNELALERTTLADERTDLAVTRTLLALDRTLMAWVRTATSLISFGFTIYTRSFSSCQSPDAPQHRLLEPCGVALVLMGLGVGGSSSPPSITAARRRQWRNASAAMAPSCVPRLPEWRRSSAASASSGSCWSSSASKDQG